MRLAHYLYECPNCKERQLWFEKKELVTLGLEDLKEQDLKVIYTCPKCGYVVKDKE